MFNLVMLEPKIHQMMNGIRRNSHIVQQKLCVVYNLLEQFVKTIQTIQEM